MKDITFILKKIGWVLVLTLGITIVTGCIGWFILHWTSGVQFSNALFMLGAICTGVGIYVLVSPRRVSRSMIEVSSARRSISGTWEERFQQQAFFIQMTIVGVLLIAASVLVDKILD